MAEPTKPSKKGYQYAGGTGTGTSRAAYTHADVAYVRKKRGSLIAEDEHDGGELNIVPYLDILVNLIMFLLVAQATLVSLGMIDVTAPTYSAPGPDSGDPSQAEKKLRLTVGIAHEGYFIAAKGGVLPGQEQDDGTGEVTPDGVEKREPTIPRLPDGRYDYPSLARKLRAIKTQFPDTTAVFVAAEAATEYEVIVKTLDASREDAQGDLFPQVAFSQIN